MQSKIFFVTLDDVLALHFDQLRAFGGLNGIRDKGLLESAVATPQASYGGNYLHDDMFKMAAAYLYHIVKNHPFLDGNKRTGAVAAFAFMGMNGFESNFTQDQFYHLAHGVAASNLDKEEVAQLLKDTMIKV